MKKIISIVLVLITTITMLAMVSCSNQTPDYDPAWIVGKTKEEIEERYGAFDSYETKTFESGNVYIYARYEGKIRISGEKKRYTDTFTITFSENGIALSASKERIADFF